MGDILNMARHIEVITSIDNENKAKAIIEFLLKNHLAACVQKIGPMESKYWWNGKIEEAKEIILVIKTTKSFYKKVEEAILRIHPYEIPEIIARPIIKGYKKYIDWIEDNCIGL